jgi:hypothetical protein
MRSKLGLTPLLIVGLLAWASVRPGAQAPIQPVSPFDHIGFIDAATVDNPTDTFSGGTITVNGTVFIVPRNTFLQMPAFGLTWQEVFTMAPAGFKASNQSGLARADRDATTLLPPPTTYEIHIVGNRVVSGTSDQRIVGLMFLSQQSLNNGAGFINYIDYATGEMRVGGRMGDPTTGARVRQNDPIGRHGLATDGAPGAGHTAAQDVRFQQDEDNPTVRSETGYPMCVARVAPPAIDPLCPEANRPKGADGTYLNIYTMAPLPFDGSQPPPGSTNPNLMVPFEVGDFVDYQGTLAVDAAGPYISAWGILDNIGVFTSPGTQPVYTAIDVMLLGVGGIPNPFLPQEAAVRTRIEGFTTDPTSFVDLFAVDVDACNGQPTWRYYATVGVDNIAVNGRWRWRPKSDPQFLPPSRMLLAVSENGFDPTTPTPNGLIPGMYTAPNFDFIFPENLGIGNPKVPNNLQDFPFLAYGSGPYAAGKLGQLSPWPGAVAPTQPVCDPTTGTAVFAPIANAGVHQSVRPGAAVTLNATASRDTNVPPRALTFNWVQTQGPHVVPFNGANTATPSFIAPFATTPITLAFTVTVGNGSTLTSSAVVTITVANPAVATDTVTITAATFTLRRAQLRVLASTTDPTAVLTLQGFGEMGPGLAIAPGVPAPPTDHQIRIVGVLNPTPTTVTVTSSSGGVATATVTVR